MDDRESKLPQWAREIIKDLRQRVQYGNEPLMAEIAKLRPRNELLERQIGAMEELLSCAAKGGHKTAAEIVETLESYSLTVTKEG